MLTKVTKEQYEETRKRVDATGVNKKIEADTSKQVRATYDHIKVPDVVLYDDLEAIEVFEFETLDKGREGYFAYWKDHAEDPRYTITTWTGALLGIVDHTRQYESPIPGSLEKSQRVAFTALCIDGYEYAGTYYKSSGDYVRMRRKVLPKKLTAYQKAQLESLSANEARSDREELMYRWLTRVSKPVVAP